MAVAFSSDLTSSGGVGFQGFALKGKGCVSEAAKVCGLIVGMPGFGEGTRFGKSMLLDPNIMKQIRLKRKSLFSANFQDVAFAFYGRC